MPNAMAHRANAPTCYKHTTESARSNLLKKIPNGETLYKEIVDAKK